VQKNLRQLRTDCDRVLARLTEVEATDAANWRSNSSRMLHGLGLFAAAAVAVAALLALLVVRAAGALCTPPSVLLEDAGLVCAAASVQRLLLHAGWVAPVFVPLAGAVAAVALALVVATRVVWRRSATLSKRDLKRVEEFREVTLGLAQANEALYEAYFSTIVSEDR